MVTAVARELETLARDYILNCEVEGKSPETIAIYGMVIRNFIWYSHQSNFPEAHDLTAMHIRGFLFYLMTETNRWGINSPATRKQVSKTTVNDYFRALRCFFNWLEREGHILINPFNNIRTPRADDKVIEPLNENEISSVLKQCSRNTVLDVRNKAIVSVLLDCGLRISELASLTTNDIDLETGAITIRNGKGGKQRIVCLGKTALYALRKYVIYHRKCETDRVFVNRSGKPLEIRGIKIMIQRLGNSAGIKIHPHKLRHTYAITYLRNGGDVFSLKYTLGHSTLQMTMRYLQSLNSADAANAHRRYSPLDNLNRK
jgi:site-specific recombinase XerD